MAPPLEIFRMEAEGALIWCACAYSLESAVRRVEALRAKTPAQFVVLSLATGHRRVFSRPSGSVAVEPKSSAA
jgi:hypothetical protein